MARDPGWSWLEPTPLAAAAEGDGLALARLFARLFAGTDGETALAHLNALTIDRCLGPEASDAALRMLEGQRQLVLHLRALIRRGRDGR